MGLLHTLTICICLLATIGSVAKGKDVKRRHHENNALRDGGSVQSGIWTPEKPRRLFARARFDFQQRQQVTRPRSRTVAAVTAQVAAAKAGGVAPPVVPAAPAARVAGPATVPGAKPAPVVARRCPGLMEPCSPHMPCCDPCASCHCRLFNTICHCWRMSHFCPKKT
ncbi:agouti-signaling protein 2b [Engraulis encrasicolus]|uniref:agouti-signaling protein 2b n=1 Tax=Engraulis encrasicolus TaxID=184585 RepID=UPI002FD00A13